MSKLVLMAGILGFNELDVIQTITCEHSPKCAPYSTGASWDESKPCGCPGLGRFHFAAAQCLGELATDEQVGLLAKVLGLLAARMGGVYTSEHRVGAALVVLAQPTDRANVVGGLAQDIVRALRCDESVSLSATRLIDRWCGAVLAASVAGVPTYRLQQVSECLDCCNFDPSSRVSRWVLHAFELRRC